MYTHSVSRSSLSALASAPERPRDELAGALFVLDGEGDQLDVGEPGDPQVRPPGHQSLGGDRIEVAAPETVDPRAGGSHRDPDSGVGRGRRGDGAGIDIGGSPQPGPHR